MDHGTKTEEQVKNFYDQKGWAESEVGTLDAELWEDLRPCAAQYVSSSRLRVSGYLPKDGGDILMDAGCGPIQYPEYISYSKNFKGRLCVDISKAGLERVKFKLGEHAECLEASLLKLPLEDGLVDSAVCIHVLYHLHKDVQALAVREMLRVLKPGGTLLILYGNSDRYLERFRRWLRSEKPNVGNEGELYYFTHQQKWWQQFGDAARVNIFCNRFLASNESKRIIPNGLLGRMIFGVVAFFESYFSSFLAKGGAYPLIVLKKTA